MEKYEKNDEKCGVKNEIKGITRCIPSRSISMDETVGHYLYKMPYSCLRQNSINDSREYNELKDRKDKSQLAEVHHSALNKKNANEQENKLKASYVTQISTISTSEDSLIKEKSNTDFKMQIDDADNELSIGYDRYDKRRPGKGICLYITTGSSCVLSVLTFGLVMFVFPKMSEVMRDPGQGMEASMGLTHNGQPNSDVSTAGSFKIDQTYLHEHKRILWLKDEYSEIIPSSFDDCLTVPYGGKYLVFSRFTFNILPQDETTIITHFFKLKTSEGKLKDGGYKRKYVSVLENKLRTSSEIQTNLELRKPSVFIEFFELDAHDQICPNVSNPDLLYESRMDNDVNIIKV